VLSGKNILIYKKGFYMSETEILSQILHELKEINNTLQDLYSGNEAQNEMLMNKLSALESISDKSCVLLSEIAKEKKS
jgi:hypothetical protein